MKQTQKAKRPRGSADERQAPLAVDPRDPDIVHAHGSPVVAGISVQPGSRTPPRRSRVMASSLIRLATQAAKLDGPLPCRREHPRLWFSDRPADLQLAKAYCQPCPMRQVCLAGAVERHESHGVWGGEIFTRGVIIAEKRPRGRPPADRGQLPELTLGAAPVRGCPGSELR